MGLYGGGGGGGNDAVDYQRQQAEKQYEYDKKVFDFQWKGDIDNPEGQHWRAFNHSVEGYEIQKQNDRIAREYKDESARKQWEHGLSINDYQHDQNMRAYTKSEDLFGKQMAFNERGFEAGIERETVALEEQFIDFAFQNQGIVQDLYEATGQAGFDQVATQLGLKQTEGELDYQKLQKLTNLKQSIRGSEFTTAGKELEMIDTAGRTDYQKASVQQDLFTQEAANKFAAVDVGLNVREAKSREQYERDVLMRQYDDSRAKAAFGIQQQYVEALQQAGQASLSQSGRSQGKAIQMIFAQLGRQQRHAVDSLVRGKAAADLEIRNAQINTLNVEARAELQKEKLDFSTLDNITRATMQLEEADRSLTIAGQKTSLDLDEIKQQLENTAETTEIDVKEIARNMKNAESKAGLDLKQIDWDIENVGSRFKTNQDILRATLDSAVNASLANKKDLVLAKYQSDIQAEAQRMLKPEKADYIDAPEPLPEAIYQDPLAPTKPPAPIKGALMQQSNPGFGSTGAKVATAAITGLSAYGSAAAIGAGATSGTLASGIGYAAPYIGAAVALGTLLFD